MVVFGAGASHDLTALHPAPARSDHRPPTTDQLFTEEDRYLSAVGRFPYVGALITDVQQALAAAKTKDEVISVEQILDGMKQRSDERRSPRLQRQLMALRYYLQDVIGTTTRKFADDVAGRTNHQTLFNRIDEWREENPEESVCLVTFNYDTLIERACREVLGRRFDTIDDYGQGPYILLKLHGSVNWLQPISINAERLPRWMGGTPEQMRLQLIEHAGEYEVDERIFAVADDPNAIQVRGNFAVPAIAIPVQAKRSLVCPPPDFATRLQLCLPDTTRLMMIGWRAAEETVLGLCRGNLRSDLRAIVVTGSTATAGEVWSRFSAKVGVSTTPTLVGDGFSGLLADNARLVRGFLAT